MNLKLSAKLISGFFLVAIITLLVGSIGWRGVFQTETGLREVATNRLPGVLSLEMISQAQAAIRKCEIILLYEVDYEIVNEQYSQLEKGWNQVEKWWNIYERIPRTTEEEKLWKEFVPKWEAWKKIHQEIIEKVKKGDQDIAHVLSFGKARDAINQASDLLNQITDLNVKIADDFTKEALPQATRAKIMTITGMALGSIAALALGIVLSLSIIRPITRVADGLNESSERVATASGQVSASSQELARGTSGQAASIEETSSSLEEMSSMTKHNAENANQANQIMNETKGILNRANDSMEHLVLSMGEISTASDETSKIIKTIDEIAFQTNLLALNAAVEAARAGEVGAGFAVVADEVRNLAMRAAEAAKNTENLIAGTVKKVRDGSELLQTTSSEFSQVAISVSKMGELIGEVSAASSEQTQGIDQINRAVSEIEKVVQQNAASAEQSASASEEMNVQAEQMKVFVGDLQSLLEGSRGDRTNKMAESPRREIMPAKTAKSPSKDLVGDVKKGNGHARSGNGNDPGRYKAGQETRAEQVIPFDGEEMSDF